MHVAKKVGSSYLLRDCELIKNTFEARNPGKSNVIEVGSDIKWGDLFKLKQQHRRRAKDKICALEAVDSEIPYLSCGSSLVGGKFVNRTDRTGLFSVKIDSDREVLLLKRLVGVGKNLHMQTLYCTDYDTEKIFLKMFVAYRKRNAKPKTGVYVISADQYGNVIYNKATKLPNPPVIHQSCVKVEKSINDYFSNRERFLRNNKSGAKRILLYGIGGGGKTTLAYQIARKYEKTHCVVFSSDINSIASHSALCAKHAVPTIIFAEECDQWMSKIEDDGGGISINARGTSLVKTFLDGHLSSRNEKGELTILITNYPERIERTILLRPGRVHERIEIGPLDDDHAFEVAKHYFKDNDGKQICNEKELEFFKNGGVKYTGAQIENIAGLVIDYVNGTDIPVNQDTIAKVVEEFKDAVNAVRSYKDKETIIDSKKPKVSGFSPAYGGSVSSF